MNFIKDKSKQTVLMIFEENKLLEKEQVDCLYSIFLVDLLRNQAIQLDRKNISYHSYKGRF